MEASITFERQALYEEVWAAPVNTVSKRYGMSDNALRKICRKLVVPLPPFGFWAKIRAGHAIERPPLPKHDGPCSVSANPDMYTRRTASSPVVDDIRRIEAEEEDPANRIIPVVRNSWQHILVRKVAKRLDEIDSEIDEENRPLRRGEGPRLLHTWQYKKGGGVLDPGIECLPVFTTPSLRQRALAIADALLVALDERGFKALIKDRKAIISCKDITARIRISELTRKHSEGIGPETWTPLGRLRVSVYSESYGSPLRREMKFQDDPGKPLEDRLNQIVVKFRCALLGYEDREKNRQIAARVEEERRKRIESNRWHDDLATAAARRQIAIVESAFAEAKQWAETDRCRRYLDHIEQNAIERGIDFSHGSSLGEWMNSIRQGLHYHDPTESRLAVSRRDAPAPNVTGDRDENPA